MNAPPKPQGSSAFARWCQWVHDELHRLHPSESHNTLTSYTTKGIFRKGKASLSEGDPVFDVVEVDVCVIDDDGTQRDGFMKVHGSIIYFKDAFGNPVDENGVAIDPADLVP